VGEKGRGLTFSAERGGDKRGQKREKNKKKNRRRMDSEEKGILGGTRGG